jgi:hypothetical protein
MENSPTPLLRYWIDGFPWQGGCSNYDIEIEVKYIGFFI